MTFVLFVLALILAIPTSGISVLLFIAYLVFKYGKSSKNSVESKFNRALAKFAVLIDNPQLAEDGSIANLPTPSWSYSKERIESFFLGVSRKALQRGVPESFINAYLADKDNIQLNLAMTALFENEGASWDEQQALFAKTIGDAFRDGATI